MNRKKVAWLLTVAMVATSVDSSVLVASGADFSAETAEIVQDFSADPENEGTVSEDTAVDADAAAESSTEAGETGNGTAESAQVDFANDNQDAGFADENGGLAEDAADFDGGAEGFTGEDFTGAEVSSDELNAADSDATVQDTTGMDSTMAENALEVGYKEFTQIPESAEGTDVVVKFTAPKDGKYEFFPSVSCHNAYMSIYDSSFQECKLEEYNTIACKAGETYYGIIKGVYDVGTSSCVTVYPTIESFEITTMPKMEYVLWDENSLENLMGEDVAINCQYSNGETEVFTNNDTTRIRIEGDNGTGYVREPGNVNISLVIDKHVGTLGAQLYRFSAGVATVRTCQEFMQAKKSEAEELPLNTQISIDPSNDDRLFYFVPEEDGRYTFSYTTSGGHASGTAKLFDENGELIASTNNGKITEELEKGKSYYLAEKNVPDSTQKLTKVTKVKNIDSITVDTPVIYRYTGGYGVNRYDALSGLQATVHYKDGTSESLRYQYGSVPTDDKDYIFVDIYSIPTDNYTGYVSAGEHTISFSIGNKTATVQLVVQSFSDYISEREAEIGTIESGTEINVEWERGKEYFYRFTPAESGDYILTGSSSQYGNLLEEDGTLINATSSSWSGTYKRVYALEAGKIYYCAARQTSGINETGTLKLYKKENVEKIEVRQPYNTTFISEIGSISYDGLEVIVTYESGKKQTYTYGTSDFSENMFISSDVEYENGKIKPGKYTLTIYYENEKIGEAPITVQSLKEYAEENTLSKLTEGQDITETHKRGDLAVYSFEASKSGQYTFSTSNALQDGSYYSVNVRVYDTDGNPVGDPYYNGSISVSLEAGKTYYFVENFTYSAEGEHSYTTSVKYRRTIEKIVLSSDYADLYLGIDDLSSEALGTLLNNVNVTLKYSDGTEEPIQWWNSTQDGDYLWRNGISDINETGDYEIQINCGNASCVYTFKVHPAIDYIKEDAKEVTEGKRISASIARNTAEAYYMVAPESGYYRIEQLGNVKGNVTCYDEEGNVLDGALQLEKGQKIYFTLRNDGYEENLKTLFTVEKQDAVLSKLTIKSKPAKTRYVENVDAECEWDEGDGIWRINPSYTGLVVTAEYTDGFSEDLKAGDISRYKEQLSMNVSYVYDEEDYQDVFMFLDISMDGIQAEPIPLEAVTLSEYLKTDGNNLEILALDCVKRMKLDSNDTYKLVRFVPEKDGTYVCCSTGWLDTVGYIYDDTGDYIEDDDDSGENNNFRMEVELKAGKDYYIAVRSYSRAGISKIEISMKNEEVEETEKLSDFELVSKPDQTVFYSVYDGNGLDYENLPYDGLKIRAKNSNGKEEVYTYSNDKKKFPFTVECYIDSYDDCAIVGKYTANVLYENQKIAEFQIEIKSLEDYLCDITTVLNPGERVKKGVYENPMGSCWYVYFKLPSDLDGVYRYDTGDGRWRVRGIYDSEGNRTNLQMNAQGQLKTDGKDYYIWLEDYSHGSEESFWYEKVPSSGTIKSVEIVSQPEVTEYVEGMNGRIDLSGMMLRITNEDGSEKIVSAEEFSDLYDRKLSILDKDGNSVSGIFALEIGENNLTLELCGAKAEFQLKVVSAVRDDADSLKPGEEAKFVLTENQKYHVYSYTPEKDGIYTLSAKVPDDILQWDDVEVDWVAVDSNGNEIGETYSQISMKAGETYYFAVYCNEHIFTDVSVQLKQQTETSTSESNVIALSLTAPAKTEYTTEEEISYEGMKIHVIYDDGSEKDYTPDEAVENGMEIYDSVREYEGMKIPGNYEIRVSGEDCYGYNLQASVPIVVNDSGLENLAIADQAVTVTTDRAGKVYSYEVKNSGTYQLEATVENGDNALVYLEDNGVHVYGEEGKRVSEHSPMLYLEAGTHYLYMNGVNENGGVKGNCTLKLLSYQSEPIDIEFVENSLNTEFVCGEDIDFAGAQFKVFFNDGTEKIVTIPEDYRSGMTLESGLRLSNFNTYIGSHYAYAYIYNADDEICRTGIPYTVKYPADMPELETGKTYTITKEQLDKTSAVYTIPAQEGMQLCSLKLENASADILDAKGNYVNSWGAAHENTVYFLTESNQTYHVVVRQYGYYRDDSDVSLQLFGTKGITGLTALPEDGVYSYGVDERSLKYVKLQLTYADGSTEVLTKEDERINLVDLRLENVSGTGVYNGELTLGSLTIPYSRKVQNVTAVEGIAEKYEKLDESKGFARIKFVPEKTQRYYYHPAGSFMEQYLTLKNENGAKLCRWEVYNSQIGMVLTAGKTYYFEISYDSLEEEGGFTISENPGVDVEILYDVSKLGYTGEEVKPVMKVSYEGKALTEGKDYQVTYTDNINAGMAIATIAPVEGGIQFVEKRVWFRIESASLDNVGVDVLPVPAQTYTGKELTPKVTVVAFGKTLEEDKDYELIYRDNVEKGIAKVIIRGIGNFQGEISQTFEIKEPEPSITPEPSKPDQPSVTPEPSKPDQPSVTPEPSKPDQPSVTPEPSKPDEPSVTPEPSPTPKPQINIANAVVTGIGDVGYTGKAVTPAPVVTYEGQVLVAGTDYDVTYSNNVKLGTATLKITGKGSYNGEKTVTFRICNKITYKLNGGTQNAKNKTTFYKQTVKFYNPTRKGYTFGGWYTDKNFKKPITSVSKKTVKNVTVYAKWVKVTKCKAPTDVKAVNSKAKTLAVSYQEVSGANGYEISYATNSKFKGATKILTKAKSKTIKKLKKGKTYYVRVRAYKMDSTGNKVFGSYSKKVKVKIKK